MVLLTDDISLRMGSWAGPPHFTSSVFLALVIASVIAVWRNAGSSNPGWPTLVVASALVFCLECIQLINPRRAFQLADIIEGIAGAAVGAMLSALLYRALGRRLFGGVFTICASLVLLSSMIFREFDDPKEEISCNHQPWPLANWQALNISRFVQHESFISASADNQTTHFCVFAGDVVTENGSLVIEDGGILSVPLNGLAAAIKKTGTLSFGVRFQAEQQQAGGPPRLVAGISPEGDKIRYLARVLQNGPHVGASLQFNRWEYSGTSMPNRVENRLHDLVIVYDGKQQTTWLDGTVTGTEHAHLNTPPDDGRELVLHIGKRTDERWLPYRGKIEAIYIGTSPLTQEQIATVFSN